MRLLLIDGLINFAIEPVVRLVKHNCRVVIVQGLHHGTSIDTLELLVLILKGWPAVVLVFGLQRVQSLLLHMPRSLFSSVISLSYFFCINRLWWSFIVSLISRIIVLDAFFMAVLFYFVHICLIISYKA